MRETDMEMDVEDGTIKDVFNGYFENQKVKACKRV